MLSAKVFLLLVAQLGGNGEEAPEPPERIRSERLENGLRVVVVEDHTLPLVSIGMWYAVGSGQDEPDRPGLCHVSRELLEHRSSAAGRLRSAGIQFSSGTLRDACHFSSVCAADQVEFLLSVEAERLERQPVMREQLDRAIAASSIAERPRDENAARTLADILGQPFQAAGWKECEEAESLAHRPLLDVMFPGRSYRHSPGIVAESIGSLSTGDVDEFLARWFVPGNAVLLIVGDVAPVTTLEAARKAFASIHWAEPPRRPDWERLEEESLRVSAPADRAGIDFGWQALPWGFFENAAVDVLVHYVCSPFEGPLHARLADLSAGRPRFVRFAWREEGLALLSVDCPSARATEIESLVSRVLTEIADGSPVEVAAINRAKAQAARDIREQRSTFAGRAHRMGLHEVIGGDVLLFDHELLMIHAVTPGSLKRAAESLRETRKVIVERRETDEPIAGDGRKAIHNSDGRSSAKPRDRGAERVRSLEERPPAWLGGGEALKLLSNYSLEPDALSAGPGLSNRGAQPGEDELHGARLLGGTQPSTPEKWMEQKTGAVHVHLRALEGWESAVVHTLIPAGEVSPAAILGLLAGSSARHSTPQLEDYLSYHAIEMRPGLVRLKRGSGLAVLCDGPAGLVPQMLELSAEILGNPGVGADAVDSQRQALKRTLHKITGHPRALADWLAAVALAGGDVRAALRSDSDRVIDAKSRQGPSPASGAAIRVVAAGGMVPADVTEVVGWLWPASTDSESLEKPSDSARANPTTRPSHKANPEPKGQAEASVQPRVFWAAAKTDTACIRVILQWPPSASPAAKSLELDAHEAAALFGVPDRLEREIDAAHAWRWQTRVADGAILLACDVTPAELSPVLQELRQRLTEVWAGTIAADELRLARRLAARWRLLREDGPAAFVNSPAQSQPGHSGSSPGASPDAADARPMIIVVGPPDSILGPISELGTPTEVVSQP